MLSAHTVLAALLIGSCACLAAGVLAVRWSSVLRARQQRELCTRHHVGGDRP